MICLASLCETSLDEGFVKSDAPEGQTRNEMSRGQVHGSWELRNGAKGMLMPRF